MEVVLSTEGTHQFARATLLRTALAHPGRAVTLYWSVRGLVGLHSEVSHLLSVLLQPYIS